MDGWMNGWIKRTLNNDKVTHFVTLEFSPEYVKITRTVRIKGIGNEYS